MKRRPTDGPEPQPPFERPTPGVRPPITDALSQSDTVAPFLVSGGFRRFFTYSDEVDGVGQADGIQLVSHLYVPNGKVAFIKQIRVAPLCPAVFYDPWNSQPILWNEADETGETAWRIARFNDPTSANEVRFFPDVWRSPFAWEGMPTEGVDDHRFPNTWTWQLTFLKGSITQIRQSRNLPAFDPNNLATYYLTPDVPAEFQQSYQGSIPGSAAGIIFGPQRWQVIQGDELDLHIPVPENTTACLFARWTQERAAIAYARSPNTVGEYGRGTDGEPLEYPIGPSIGQMSGYMQPLRSKGSVTNAVYGWGG